MHAGPLCYLLKTVKTGSWKIGGNLHPACHPADRIYHHWNGEQRKIFVPVNQCEMIRPIDGNRFCHFSKPNEKCDSDKQKKYFYVKKIAMNCAFQQTFKYSRGLNVCLLEFTCRWSNDGCSQKEKNHAPGFYETQVISTKCVLV